ncbi:MAG: hypothetical protein NWR52_05430 [Paracoccaceae bacterium]|nr:hypothetical protein [Paracoccaceae bacterium]
MNDEDEMLHDPVQSAAARLIEIAALTEDIRLTLTEMRKALRDPGGPKPKDLLTKLNELHAAHLKVLAAEEAFNAKTGRTADDDAPDLDAIRADIGRQLDRIRASLGAAGLSG